MVWVVLLVAGLFETVWAVALKASNGLTRPGPTALTVVAMALSVFLLGVAMKTLPLGTAYAVWTGVGALGAVVIGIVFFGEPSSPARLFCAGMILAGIVGLRLVTPG